LRVHLDNDVGVVALLGDHLAELVGGDAAHVVVHGGAHGDGLFRHVHARKDRGLRCRVQG
jgi:hypothetical protein